MYQSRLVKHIRELSAKGRERFLQFTYSPYFNQHEKTQELLTLILDRIDGPAGKLEKEKVFRALFKGEPYNEQQLHNVMSYLKKLYHDFLAYEHFEQKRYNKRLYTLQAAHDQHQFDLMTNRSKQLQKKLEKDLIHDSEYYYTTSTICWAIIPATTSTGRRRIPSSKCSTTWTSITSWKNCAIAAT